MKTRILLLALAAALLEPGLASAREVHVPAGPPNFDGSRPRPEDDAVSAGSSIDKRTPGQIAKDEQLKADARVSVTARLPGPDAEIEPPKPNEWLKTDHILRGLTGALVGLLVGSFWGLAGLAIGALIGGLIGYGVSLLAAKVKA